MQLSRDLLAEIDVEARASFRDRSTIIRIALVEYLISKGHDVDPRLAYASERTKSAPRQAKEKETTVEPQQVKRQLPHDAVIDSEPGSPPPPPALSPGGEGYPPADMRNLSEEDWKDVEALQAGMRNALAAHDKELAEQRKPRPKPKDNATKGA